jgi:hypothetical protein
MHYGVALLPLVISVATVVWVCCAWASVKLGSAQASVGKLEESFVLALTGAYVWSVYEILSRSRSRDLTPDILLEMTLRYIAAVPIGYAFSLFAQPGFAPTLAFASAAFPLRDLRLLWRKRALRAIESKSSTEARASEGHLRTTVDGLSDTTLARLEELQIVTFLDLAYANPVRLMARTGYSLRHLLAWIDQALLAVYGPSVKPSFTRIGLPCALDVSEFYEVHCYDPKTDEPRDWQNDPAVLDLAKALDVPLTFVPEVLVRVHTDPHVQFLASIWYAGLNEAKKATQGPPKPATQASAGGQPDLNPVHA